MSRLLQLLNNKKLRTRPGMFIGECSLTKLAAFIRGYSFALYELGEPDGPLFEGFQNWVVQRLRVPNYHGWESAILKHCPSEAEAFKLFWELLDEYTARDGLAFPAEPRINGATSTDLTAKQDSRP
jgi:hypothetical protein